MKENVLTELHHEKGTDEFSVGDIYLGRVRKVVPALNAAFVDVGYEKDAFLHYLDLGPQFRTLDKFTKKYLNTLYKTGDVALLEQQPDLDKEGKIQDVLSQGQLMTIQVAKEPISSKGPRLSAEITLAGRYIVLVPFANKISLSQKIKDPAERERLRNLMLSIKPNNYGVIIRTVAVKKKVADLDNDLRELISRWEATCDNLFKSKPPKRILGELSKTSVILRDLLTNQFNSIQVNDELLYTQIKDYVKGVSPEYQNIVKHYTGTLPIFEQFGVHKQIKAAFGKQVNLKSGGYLIIEHTEAMHVIDVNSGNRKGSENQEENALTTNMEAADEIARVLRLRDMGGIIAVDFIDMGENANQKALFEHLRKCMKDDKAKHHVLPPSKFGVVEITRQRVRPETDIKTAETCPTCKGTGDVQATVLLTDDIDSDLDYILKELKPKGISLKVHPFVAAYISSKVYGFQRKWLVKHKRWIKVTPDTTLHLLDYQFYNTKGEQVEA